MEGRKNGVRNMITGRIALMKTNQILVCHPAEKPTFTMASASKRRTDNKRRSSEANKRHIQLRAVSFIFHVNNGPKS